LELLIQSFFCLPQAAPLTSCLELQALDWGLPHLRLGGISSTVLGILVAAAAVAVGRDKLKETPMSASLVLEEGTTVCAGGRSAR